MLKQLPRIDSPAVLRLLDEQQTKTEMVLLLFSSKDGGTPDEANRKMDVTPCEVVSRALRIVAHRGNQVYEIDIDDSPDIASKFEVKSVPTVLALSKGVEVDRVRGQRTSADFDEWIVGLNRGLTERAMLASQLDDFDHRHRHVKLLCETNQLSEALLQFQLLWNSAEPSTLSQPTETLVRLCAHHPPAIAWAQHERDRLELAVHSAPSFPDIRDFVLLNVVLGDEQRTLRWFDEAKKDLPSKVPPALMTALKRAARWEDLGRLIEPWVIESECAAAKKNVAHGVEHLRCYAPGAAETIRALAAAGRELEAQRIRRAYLDLDPSNEMSELLSKHADD